MRYLLKNGMIVTPSSIDKGSLLIKGSKIVKIFKMGDELPSVKENELLDCEDCYILPGIIDPHVHMRDFEQIQKETIETATKAAITNGITTVIGMPNTIPPLDSVENIKSYIHKIEHSAHNNVGLYARLPSSEEFFTYIREIKKLGLFGIKIYPGDSPQLLDWDLLLDLWDKLKENFNEYTGDLEEFTHKLDVFLDHHYTKSQLREFAIKWDPILSEIGKNGLHMLFHADVPLDSKTRKIRFKTFEEIHKSSLIAHSANHSKLQELFHIYFIFQILRIGSCEVPPPITFCHVSSIEAIRLIRHLSQKLSFENIFIEITPHHMYLNQDIQLPISSYGKVLPPLRTREDNIEIQKLLVSKNLPQFFYGTDHAPHSVEEKSQSFFNCPPGFPSLDVYTKFVLSKFFENGWDLRYFVHYASDNPARIYQIKKKGRIQKGYGADLTVIRRISPYTLDKRDFQGTSSVCPYPLDNLLVNIEVTFVNGMKVQDMKKGRFITRSYKWKGTN